MDAAESEEKEGFNFFSFNIRYLLEPFCMLMGVKLHTDRYDGMTPRGGKDLPSLKGRKMWKLSSNGFYFTLRYRWGSSARGVEAKGGLMTEEEV